MGGVALLDNWPKSGYCLESGYQHDRPALGVCFDTGRIGTGKYGLKCWEILWRAVQPRLISGSELFEGNILESEHVYCLAIQNNDVWRLEHVKMTLERNTDFLNVCASRHFYEGEDVLREPLVAAGQVNETGTIIGISYNPRQALNSVRRDQAAVLANVLQGETRPGADDDFRTAVNAAPAAGKPGLSKKWWQVLRL